MARTRVLVPLVVAAVLAGCVGPLSTTQQTADTARVSDDIPVSVLQRALEQQPSGSSVIWRDRFSGEEGSVTPVRTFRAEGGQFCRAFEAELISLDGVTTTWSGVACREQDGGWVPT